MLWIVPAKVQGKWRFKGPGGAFDADLEQKYQHFGGTAGGGRIDDGRINGEAVSFSYSEGGKLHHFSGTVSGDEIRGNVDQDGAAAASWTGSRRH